MRVPRPAPGTGCPVFPERNSRLFIDCQYAGESTRPEDSLNRQQEKCLEKSAWYACGLAQAAWKICHDIPPEAWTRETASLVRADQPAMADHVLDLGEGRPIPGAVGHASPLLSVSGNPVCKAMAFGRNVHGWDRRNELTGRSNRKAQQWSRCVVTCLNPPVSVTRPPSLHGSAMGYIEAFGKTGEIPSVSRISHVDRARH